MSRDADFWSRRRAAVAREETEEIQRSEQAALAAELARREEKTDAEILAELDLPDPDDLKLGDDVRGFMAKAVPDRLRRRALRRLWRLNPVLANVDGLVDYGQDFTDAALAVENLQTAYQVGKGMLQHVLAQDEARLDPPADAPPAPVETSLGVTEADPPPLNEAAAPEAGVESAANTTLVATDSEVDPALDFHAEAPRPRRMRFRFDRENT